MFFRKLAVLLEYCVEIQGFFKKTMFREIVFPTPSYGLTAPPRPKKQFSRNQPAPTVKNFNFKEPRSCGAGPESGNPCAPSFATMQIMCAGQPCANTIGHLCSDTSAARNGAQPWGETRALHRRPPRKCESRMDLPSGEGWDIRLDTGTCRPENCWTKSRSWQLLKGGILTKDIIK